MTDRLIEDVGVRPGLEGWAAKAREKGLRWPGDLVREAAWGYFLEGGLSIDEVDGLVEEHRELVEDYLRELGGVEVEVRPVDVVNLIKFNPVYAQRLVKVLCGAPELIRVYGRLNFSSSEGSQDGDKLGVVGNSRVVYDTDPEVVKGYLAENRKVYQKLEESWIRHIEQQGLGGNRGVWEVEVGSGVEGMVSVWLGRLDNKMIRIRIASGDINDQYFQSLIIGLWPDGVIDLTEDNSRSVNMGYCWGVTRGVDEKKLIQALIDTKTDDMEGRMEEILNEMDFYGK